MIILGVVLQYLIGYKSTETLTSSPMELDPGPVNN